jgi:ferritin-like protein
LVKVVQLYEACEVRPGMMIFEHSGSMKTCIIKTLIKALCDERGSHKLYTMNHTAIKSSQMFGTLDPS